MTIERNERRSLQEDEKCIIKYKEDPSYKREGNNLIGKFQFAKQYENCTTKLPYPIELQQEYSVSIKNGEWKVEGLGFWDKETGKPGDYIIIIQLI